MQPHRHQIGKDEGQTIEPGSTGAWIHRMLFLRDLDPRVGEPDETGTHGMHDGAPDPPDKGTDGPDHDGGVLRKQECQLVTEVLDDGESHTAGHTIDEAVELTVDLPPHPPEPKGFEELLVDGSHHHRGDHQGNGGRVVNVKVGNG